MYNLILLYDNNSMEYTLFIGPIEEVLVSDDRFYYIILYNNYRTIKENKPNQS